MAPTQLKPRATRAELPVNPADDPAWARDLAVIATETTAEMLEAAVAEDGGTLAALGAGETWELDPEGRLRRWATQPFVAQAFGVSERHVRRLEANGLPAVGHHDSCRYPWPHAMWWYIAYGRRAEGREGVTMADAWRVWAEIQAADGLQIAQRMERDPAFRREIRQVDHDRARSILAARQRLAKKRRPDAPTAPG